MHEKQFEEVFIQNWLCSILENSQGLISFELGRLIQKLGNYRIGMVILEIGKILRLQIIIC